MSKEIKIILTFGLWSFFLATVALAVVDTQEYLAYGMIAWCAGCALFVSAIAQAIRG